jgi:hypothetical protein
VRIHIQVPFVVRGSDVRGSAPAAALVLRMREIERTRERAPN